MTSPFQEASNAGNQDEQSELIEENLVEHDTSVPSGLLRAPSNASSTDSWVPVEPPTAQPSYVQEPPLCAEGSQAVSAAEPAGTLQTLDPQALQLSEAQQPRAAKGVGFASEPTYSEGSPPRTGRSRSESPSTLARDGTIVSNSPSIRTTPRESSMPPWAGSDSASDAATLTKRKSQALYLAALMQGDSEAARRLGSPETFKTFRELVQEARLTHSPQDVPEQHHIAPRNMAQVVNLDLDLVADCSALSAGQMRRSRAALNSVAGPPKLDFKLKPLPAEPEDTPLDGFALIRACGLELPDDVEEIRLEDRGLSSIVREDIQFFTALKSLQLDNNRITDFSALGELPQLRKLSLSSNKLQTLPVVVNIGESAQEPFFALQSLDVSFNLLPVRSVFSQESGWARLPGLRELDLSGNNLRKLPDALGAFPSLRSLTLEYNGLASDCLKPLAALPALQELSLAHNKIDCIPDRISTRPGSFSKLQRIDLSFNYIRRVEGLQALEGLNNGVEVLIGNNPIAANLTNRRIQPHCVPNCHPGTVTSSADIYGSMTVPITARNPKAAGEAGASAEKDLLRSSTVTIRVKRNVPDRPSLAKSLTCGLNTVNSSMAECMQDLTRGAVTFQGLTHSKIVDVFDQLHQELDNWQLASVAEGQESRERLAESSTEDVDLGDTFMTDVYVPVQAPSDAAPSPRGAPARKPSAVSSLGLELDDFEDPTEQLAYHLGLDPLLLTHHTGLVGTDCMGSLARLKFALAHPSFDPSGGPLQPHHQRLTASATFKVTERKQTPLPPLLSLPVPPSPLAQQVGNIEGLLASMKARLLQVQDDVAGQLEAYEHLVDPLDRELDTGMDARVAQPLVRQFTKGQLAVQRFQSRAVRESSDSRISEAATNSSDVPAPAVPAPALPAHGGLAKTKESRQSAVLKSAAASAVLGYSV